MLLNLCFSEDNDRRVLPLLYTVMEKSCINVNLRCRFVPLQGSNVVEDQDLLEIGILNSAHRQRLLQAIRLLPRVSTAADHTL